MKGFKKGEIMNIKKSLYVFRARFIVEAKKYFRYPVNVVMQLVQPIMWIAPFYFMGKCFSVGGNTPGFQKYTGNSDFIGFLVLGYMVSIYVDMVFWTLGLSLKEEMRQGVLESNWTAPVNRVLLMVSKGTFQFCASTLEIILTGIVCHFAFGFNINSQIFKVILFLVPGLIGMMGLGLIISALVLLVKEANPIIDLSNSIISALSGGFFPIKVLPKVILFVSMALPLTYMYDSSRAILISQLPIVSLKYEFIIIIISMVALCLIGSAIFMRVEKKCRTLGILGTH